MSSRYVVPAGDARVVIQTPNDFNIDGGTATLDTVVLNVPYAIVLNSARVVYTEATGASPTPTATVQIGTTVGGAQVVQATTLAVSKAVGAVQDLILQQTAISADTPIIVRHTGQVAPCAGQYFVQLDYTMGA